VSEDDTPITSSFPGSTSSWKRKYHSGRGVYVVSAGLARSPAAPQRNRPMPPGARKTTKATMASFTMTSGKPDPILGCRYSSDTSSILFVHRSLPSSGLR
jgi:hypothetical protein